MRTIAIQLTASILVVAPGFASTWIVDDNGGAGVDFTDIASAVSASVPGDVILVRAGTYGGFTLTSGLAILGDDGAIVTTGIQIQNLPAGQRATLANLSTSWIDVRQCAASVTLEDITTGTYISGGATPPGTPAKIAVTTCADVRLRNVGVPWAGALGTLAALSVASARVEVTGSTLHGANGRSHDIYTYPGEPQNGGDGIVATGTAIVHVSSSDVRGGGGGNVIGTHLCYCPTAAAGGAGVRLGAGASALFTGPASATIHGGDQGLGDDCGTDGLPGNGVVVAPSASLLWSGCTIDGAISVYGCTPPAAAIVGPATHVVPDDPTLTVRGTLVQGQHVTFTLHGAPGSTAQLVVGRQLVVVDLPGVEEDRLTNPLRTYALGTLPASGEATFTFTLPGSLPKGFVVVAQGRTTSPTGDVALTPSLPITLR